MTAIDVKQQRQFFQTGTTLDYQFRLAMLGKLYQAIKQSEEQVLAALQADLNKPTQEAYFTEVGQVYAEITYARKHLKQWMQPKKVHTPLSQAKAHSFITHEPYGVVLIIAPWNYPFSLAMEPLVGAIAAGNCAIIKPSELVPQTSAIIAQIVNKTFPSEYLLVETGDDKVATALLAQNFDYIFFTGSTRVGKIVMTAAAQHLTPLSLELGGKCPCILCDDIDWDLAAKRIAFGKCMNAGQTCIAPDYLLLPKGSETKFVAAYQKALNEFFPQHDYSTLVHIVNDSHFKRLTNYLKGAKIALGGKSDAKLRFIEPTLLQDVSWDDTIMQDEIFGPILPMLTYTSLNEAIQAIQARPKPLACYLFTNNNATKEAVLKRVTSGGGCINDTLVHAATSELGFGGVGPSGMGRYHGKQSFNTFSNHKGILERDGRMELQTRYRPYGEKKLALVKKVLK